MTFWLPRICASAFKKVSLVIPYCLNSAFMPRFGYFSTARNRCSTEVYSSPIALASSGAFRSTLLRSAPIYGLAPLTLTRASSAFSTDP